MKLSNIVSLNNNKCGTFHKESIFSLGVDLIDTRIYAMEDTFFYNEIMLIEPCKVTYRFSEDIDLIILSEPKNKYLIEDEFVGFLNKYKKIVKLATEQNIKIVHISSNIKWYCLFQDIINYYNIPLYLTNDNYINLKDQLNDEDVITIDEYLSLSDFNYYSNEINNNLLIDLTMYDGKKSFYNSNIDSVLNTIDSFDQTTILLEEGSYFPDINLDNVKIIYSDNIPTNILENHSYVYIFTNKAYETNQIYKILYYAANSKIVFTNYNFKVNNFIPSVILNLTNKLNLIKPLNFNDAFDILNENRNTILYNYTTLNIINNIFKTQLNIEVIKPLKISDTLDYFEDDLFLECSESSDIKIEINDYKYDLEKTLAFPILFMNKKNAKYIDSYLRYDKSIEPIHIKKKIQEQENKNYEKHLSVIVPIHNNGKYLKYKCLRSLKLLSCYHDLEIIFIDDGSSDKETLRIIRDICSNNDIVLKRFEKGSGSASRPRNVGIYLSSTDLITYLDPDNEAVYDGYTILLEEMKNDFELDMIVGDIVREDNIKRNVISYSNKVKNAINTDIITNTKETLIKTKLTVQSIQGLIVRKDIISSNNIQMVEGAAGQDTLYFQELLLHCDKVKVINAIIHSYYAYVEGSITNTVTHKFFEKFYEVEKERIKFLETNNLIEHYMKIKFNFYLRNWYFKKYNQTPEFDKKKAREYILNIISLYKNYTQFFDQKIWSFIKDSNDMQSY